MSGKTRTSRFRRSRTEARPVDGRRTGGGRAAFDGEIEVMTTPIEYRIERDALRIVVPEPVPELAENAPDARAAS
jgi:hypothetical protein